MLRSRAEV